jgi:putative flippase GtrA
VQKSSKSVGDQIHRSSGQELFLFGLVGAVNTAFGYCVYALCLYIGWTYQVASALSMLSSVVVGFVGQGHIVFKNSEPRRLMRYLLMWLGLLVLYNSIVGRVMSEGYSPYVGGLFAIPPVIAASFFAQKYFVFRQ